MNCEQARWVEFETEESRAHAAVCVECAEWLADGEALRVLANDVVPARKPSRSGLRPVMAAMLAAAAALVIGIAPQQIAPPPMPSVAAAKPVLPLPAVSPRPAPVVAQRPKTAAVPDLYLKIETSDPDVIIYWTVEGGAE